MVLIRSEGIQSIRVYDALARKDKLKLKTTRFTTGTGCIVNHDTSSHLVDHGSTATGHSFCHSSIAPGSFSRHD